MMTEDEQATLVMLAKAATRGSASYEYEIDTLRVALRRLLNAEYDDNGMDYCDWTPEMKAALKEWHDAREYARAAIDRTDWRKPE